MNESRIKTRIYNGRKEIFDPVRRKFVVLTPEEWVRQVFVDYLIHQKKYPAGLISIENEVKGHYKKSRTDIRVYNTQKDVLMVIECKAPEIKLSNQVFEQASRYNMQLKAPWLVITNGKEYFCAHINHKSNSSEFINEIPQYNEINQNG